MPASGRNDREATDWVELGSVNGVFGVKGWVKVYSFTRPRESILGYAKWYLNRAGAWVPYELKEGRPQRGGVVARLAGSDDRSAAEALVGSRIAIPATMLAKPAKDEYFWRDLIGLAVENVRGESLGRVGDLMETGANDVLVVEGESTTLVPFTSDAVVDVDLSAGRIVVDWEREF